MFAEEVSPEPSLKLPSAQEASELSGLSGRGRAMAGSARLSSLDPRPHSVFQVEAPWVGPSTLSWAQGWLETRSGRFPLVAHVCPSPVPAPLLLTPVVCASCVSD